MRGGRDEADVALVVAVGAVVRADGEQAGELALRTGVGLEGHRVVAGDLGEPLLQLADERRGSRRPARAGAKGWMLRELRPGDRLHLGGRVELHGAGAQRDHAAVQRVVAVGEPAQVAQHRGLGAVLVEDRVGQVVVGAQQCPRAARRPRGGVQRLDVGRRRRRRTRRRSAGPGSVVSSQAMATWSASTRRRLTPPSRAAATTSAARPGTRAVTRVEVGAVHDLDAARAQPLGEERGVAVGAPGDRPPGRRGRGRRRTSRP